MEEKEILSKIVDVLVNTLDPKLILLFGSRAKRKHYKNADFDIAIDTEMDDLRKERKIKEKIEKITGLYKVDFTYLKNVNEKFREIILKTGTVIYERRT